MVMTMFTDITLTVWTRKEVVWIVIKSLGLFLSLVKDESNRRFPFNVLRGRALL